MSNGEQAMATVSGFIPVATSVAIVGAGLRQLKKINYVKKRKVKRRKRR